MTRPDLQRKRFLPATKRPARRRSMNLHNWIVL
jgi:hypothetical protein